LAAFVTVIAASQAFAVATDQRVEVRMVGIMHENLAAINEIEEALVRDDYGRVETEAAHLKSNAGLLKDVDLASLGLDPKKDASFDKHLAAQAESADAIADGAQRRDAAAVLLGVQRLFDDSCVVCHADFREADQGRTPPVLFMRSLLSSVQSINRGIAMDDYSLVAREAREIGAIAHILTWSQVIEAMFLVKDPAEKTEFRGYFEALSTGAIQVERAATERNAAMISAATQRMLREGCVTCHTKFREEIRESAKRRR
jgi:HPt (histidine-containing phosphotransfer) domain-containing protein